MSMTGDEKQAFANEAEKALEHPLVEEVIDELLFNLRLRGQQSSLPRYGIKKVAMYVATVARAQALGIDPDTLRMTNDESDEVQMRLVEAALGAGKPVIAVIADAPTAQPTEEA